MALPSVASAGVLWRVTAHHRKQRVEPGHAYWWENQRREPAGTVVFQHTLAGEIVFRDPAGDHPVPAGHAALFAYGEPTAYGWARGAKEAYVCEWATLRGAGLKEHVHALRLRHGSVLPVDATVVEEFHRALDAADPRLAYDPVVQAGLTHSFVMRLFSSLQQDLLRKQSPLDQAIDDLLSNPMYPWSLKQLAEHHGISREHFARVFSQRFGLPPGNWLNQARLKKVRQLLRETNLPVGDIALQCGFASAHTLARNIREETGLSPRAWRERNARRPVVE